MDTIAAGPEIPTIVLEASSRAPAMARGFLADQFREWEIGDDSDARVVVSELTTNAWLHGAGMIVVRLYLGERDGLPVVEVWDEGRERPVVRSENHAAISGRGLLMVGLLAQEWGVRELVEGGKLIWARMAA